MALLLLSSIAMSIGFCRCDFDTTQIRVFPAVNRSIAGVFQVSFVNYLNQANYNFNASEARSLCLSLGVNIASISQVQKALTRGLETCRFGWTDEHLAVIPRIRAQVNCGQNKTGLVEWREALSKKFDVFCFNESDTAELFDPTTTSMPTTSTSHSVLHRTSSITSQPIFFTHVDSKAEQASIVGSVQGSPGKKTVVITSVVAVFLVALVTVVYIKVKRKADKEPYIEREEWTHVKYTDAKKSGSTKVVSV
uniref:Link domain-containing protein n=1 Tax=Neogobius melanostomus TaxID=47308 RepID=A0A8C6SSN9_9GOBI